MAYLYSVIRERRRRRGAIDFELPESKIILDQSGHPLEIKPYERNTATKLIEDFMLLANETVAQHFYWLQTPFVYQMCIRDRHRSGAEGLKKKGKGCLAEA